MPNQMDAEQSYGQVDIAYPMRSSKLTASLSSSLYAGITTDKDLVGSEKMDGGGT